MEADSSTGVATPVIRHPELWFEDGNIIIQADHTIFKVFRSVLTRESRFFKDMFSLPQPATSSKTYEGCQLLYMHDSAEEMTILMRAVFESASLYEICLGFEYATILRLSAKYQMLGLRTRTIQILAHEYPGEPYSQFCHIWDGCDCLTGAYRVYEVDMDDSDKRKMDVAIINAARRADALILLPSAMLSLYYSDMEFIVSCDLDSINRDAILIALPKLWSIAKNHSYKAIMADTQKVSTDCQTPGRCVSVRSRLRRETETAPCLINPMIPIEFTEEPASEFCKSCLDYVKETCETGRKIAWQMLPEAFGLSDWDTLSKQEAEFGECD